MIMSGTGGDVLPACPAAWFIAMYGLLFLLDSVRGAISGLCFDIRLAAILK